MNKQPLLTEFKNYTSAYNASDPKIALKIEHTFRVADIAEEIAKSLPQLSEDEVDLAWLLGLLHDIGRFEQLKRYGTFVDVVSIDHAELGADILFKEGLIDRFWTEPITKIFAGNEDPAKCEKNLIELAIRQHNKLNLPEDLNETEKLFCDLLRDADKVDIFRVIHEIPFEVRMTKKEERTDLPAREDVMKCVHEHRCVPRLSEQTGFECHISYCAMAFELVFEKSKELAKEQGYLTQMLSYEPESEPQKRQMEELRAEVRNWGLNFR